MLMLPDLLATLLYAFGALRLRQHPAPTRESTVVLAVAAAVAIHGLAIGMRATPGDVWQLGLGDALTLFIWLCCGLHLLLALRMPLWHLGQWLWPSAALLIPLAWWLPEGAARAMPDSLALRLHILLSMLAYACLSLAALQTVSYALLDKRLHRGRHPHGQPPLQVMEDLLFRLITIGFILLCAGIASGFLFVDDFFAQHLAHKAMLSLLACGLFGGLILGRVLRGWRGRTAIRWTYAAYAILLLAYFGSKLVLEQILGRSWS